MKKFSWGNYDYSNLSEDLIKNINTKINKNTNNSINSTSSNSNTSKIKEKLLNPIKSKVSSGVGKIQSTKIYNTISSKFKSEKKSIHSDNPSGIVINKENSLDIISKISSKEKYMKEMQSKEETSLLISGNNEYIEHDEETGLPIVSEYQLNCVIDDYKDKVIGKELTVFYKIEIFSSLSGKKWDIYHSISEFMDLYLVYRKFFLDTPEINFGNFSPKIIKQPLIHREFISKLNAFINNIIKRPALITTPYIINFLKLKNHFDDISLYKPLLLYDSTNDVLTENFTGENANKFNINAIYYLYDAKLLFIGTGNDEDNSIYNSMYNSMKKKINKLFKNQDPTFGTYGKENPNNISRGKFIIYNIINNNNGEIMFVELKCIDVISEIIRFDYWYEKNYVTLCLKNGQILIFKIFINEPSSTTKEIIEYIGTINEHFSLPLCCIINFKCGYTYSFGQYEKSIKICDLNYQNIVKEVTLLKKSKGFICIDYTISLECLYVQDDDGTIYFIDIIRDYSQPYIIKEFKNFLPCDNNSLGERDKGKIVQIFSNYYLLVGGINKENKNKNCILSIYLIQINFNYNNNDNINIIKLREVYLGGIVSITDVNINNNEDIIIALSNGSICIFNKCYNYPEYIIDAHLKMISGFIWIEKQKMIITASHDKSIKVYQFPIKWPAEFLRINKQINDLSIINEIKSETKTLYEELYSNFNNTNDNSNNKFYGNIWEIGKKNVNNDVNNDIIKDFWKYKNNMDNKNNINKNEDYGNNEDKDSDDEENDINVEDNYHYPKPEKYDKFDIIFCDDLNGWSKYKRLID